ncbi:hypothetical protein [Rhodanobacter sp. A1T4]|uniref:hypothetical protein n=1 Tax=Rhodanobacter sp. A1T4 TaxID=2723087 RepID=UPI00160EA661|nr:hypothetical protein [Rhodanobacter sp. A1T4]MBB6246336.1 hypothetical protein [Rhodanobacter sp. A1T4]
MAAVEHIVSAERARIQAEIPLRYEKTALGINFFTTDVEERRSNAFIEVAIKGIEELRDFIREKHVAFLSEKPKFPLLPEWQSLATSQLSQIGAYCGVAHQAVVNRSGRADPVFQRQSVANWEARLAPLVQNFTLQLDANSVLMTPRDTERAEPILSRKFVAEEMAKPVIKYAMGGFIFILTILLAHLFGLFELLISLIKDHV